MHGTVVLILEGTLRKNIKIPSPLLPIFHKVSWNHLGGSVTQLVTIADISQNSLGPLAIRNIVTQ